MQDAYRGHIREAANRQRSGQSVGDEAFQRIDRLRASLAQNSADLDSLDTRELSIRADFEAQLKRYRFLEEEWAEETGDS